MKLEQHKTAFFFALRYLFAKKQHNIINVISLISMIGIMVSGAALVIVLSVFNGMEQMIGGWFNAFNPDFEITLAEGKSFATEAIPMDKIASLPEVSSVHEVVSDLTLATYGECQELVRLKGVSPDYLKREGYADMLIDGSFDLYHGSQPCAIVGNIAAGKLQINLLSYDLMKLYYPKRTKKNLSNPAEAFNTRFLHPSGVFNTNTTHDQTVVFCPIEFVRELMQYEGQLTSLEVQLKNSKDYAKVQPRIQELTGDKFIVKNKYQQEETLFRTMQSEKLIIYVILSFILLVAAFNIIGSLGMLILEKRSDTRILRNMGAPDTLLSRIFLYEGVLISCIGGLAGMVLGAVICLIQQTFHVVKLGGGDHYLVQHYPVAMQFTDFIWVGITILAISLITSCIPALAMRRNTHKK